MIIVYVNFGFNSELLLGGVEGCYWIIEVNTNQY